MTQASLDVARDIAIEYFASLVKAGVNAALEPALGTKAVEYVYGAPLPPSLLRQTGLPAMTIYRFEDRDRDKGDWVFEDTTTYRFDYVAPATPLMRLPERWPLLRTVWATTLGVCRRGAHPAVNGGQPLYGDIVGLCRYVLGSGRVRYNALPGQDPYPSFEGQMQFESNYEWPEGFSGVGLDNFEELWTDWDIKQDFTEPYDASNSSTPEQ